MQKITPFLWFDGKAEEAVNFYLSIFPDAKIIETMRYGDAGPGPKGAVMSITFQLHNQEFIALNGNSEFAFSLAISFFITCETQDEVDRLWESLGAGGKEIQCGWLTDKFGLTWQIVPAGLLEMLQDKDAEKSTRVMKAMMQMVKLDIGVLKQAYRGQ